MKVVKHKITGRLVYRELPDFKEGLGIINAVLMGFGPEKELEEVEATQAEWDAELELREQERPSTVQEQLGQLKDRVSTLEVAKAELNR